MRLLAQSLWRAPLRFVLLATLLTAAGCWNPPWWAYNTPPTAIAGRDPNLGTSDKRVVVFGDFDNPTNPLGWTDVGAGVSQSLSNSLLNQGDFDVWYNPGLAAQVKTVLEGPTTERALRLGEIHDKHQEVRYVVVGAVTDFHHTGEVPREARRRTFLFWTAKEAIAAIDFSVVDLKARRVILADHVYGLADSGRRKQTKVYENLEYGSYLFWNSPLGRATEKAVRNAMVRFEETVPSAEEGVHLAKMIEYRRYEVRGDGLRGLGVGDDLFVGHFDKQYGQTLPVKDPATMEPLRARILSIKGDTAEVWLLGQPPSTITLADIELMNRLPREPTAPPAMAGALPDGR